MLVEVQLLNAILNGGSFAVVVLLAIWLVQRGIPMFREVVEKQRTDFMGELDEKRQEFLIALEKIEVRHSEALQKIEEQHLAEQEECRRERRDIAKQWAMDREADRVSRHNLANQFQQAIIQMSRALPDRPAPGDDHGRPT